ncbi:TPA: restriction endonuclease subunit S [Escherichia coli]|jgi:type I restriction enzyme, S subunit|uniref:Restriction endonuclease subunit S n=2 Tax=Enterobacteriaceae TaxID=543 RepID=A0AB37VCP2_ENTCL|nr:MULTISPECIES: restriction endonuclease subunit S [Enterobacteriaceae]EFO3460547.1 restriction endonuclease subunit S [Escherichia coli]EFR7061550.1 restriction endonuclease subunit S [Escherichia coli]EGD4964239.1 restriction endonuclease subunit S [Escherichia coli]EGF7354039.1 restriction endonuclease subunit S [Escherichia coli]EGJ8040816.1 restriction endonuclease subunit S [Escherichia coli]
MVPKGWEIKHLSELASKISDGIHKTPLYADTSEIYFINGNNLKSGSIVIQDSTKCVDENDAINHRKDLGVRTLLMSINGTIGNLAYYRGENVVLGKSASYINIKDSVNLDFIYYVLSSSKTQAFYESELTGTTIRNLSIKSIKSTEILTPPLPEQKKIAQILSTWDKAISVTEKLLANSQQQKKALMQQLLTGKKRLLDENGVRFSGKWIWLRAAELFKTISQKNNSEDEELLAVTQDLGVIPRSMLERRVVMPDGSTKGYKLVVSGNFIISLRSFQGGLEYSRYRGLVSPAYTVLTPIKKIVDEFYMQYYKSYDFIGHLAVAVIGIRDGKQISYEDFSFLKLPYPEIEEQQKIATVLSAADDEIATLEKKLACLRDEKKALMQQLLTGKRRVKVDEAVAE